MSVSPGEMTQESALQPEASLERSLKNRDLFICSTSFILTTESPSILAPKNAYIVLPEKSEDMKLQKHTAMLLLPYSTPGAPTKSLNLFAEKLLIDKLPDALCDDGLLPLPEARLCEVFGRVDGHSFWEQQTPFRPVRLIRYDEVVYENDSCPLPFVEDPELIGSGSYAKVYKVKIEKGHLIMDEATGSAYNVSVSLDRLEIGLIKTIE